MRTIRKLASQYRLAVAAVVGGIVLMSLAGEAKSAPANEGSRAAWWLRHDEVVPVVDLVNTAKPGSKPVFKDRLGGFAVAAEDRALTITGDFPRATIWRFDVTTFDQQYDMRRLYVKHGNVAYPNPDSIWSRRFAALLGDPEKALTHTGPWDVYGGEWMVPTMRVSFDGKHVYTSWFDLPSLEDHAAGRVYASFALDIEKPGKHTIRLAFDDFPRHTRWRPPHWLKEKPEVTYTKNYLRSHHVGSIAIGEDERVRDLEDVRLKPELVGKHPRISPPNARFKPKKEGLLAVEDVQKHIMNVDPDRGELWEYSDDAESMASGNDMNTGNKGSGAARTYDQMVSHLSPEAKKEWDKYFLKRFHGLYTFFVFQRNYHPTGYAQNHSSATVNALAAAGAAWDGPEGRKWLQWAAMVCRNRVKLLGRDGGLEWMNESRHYGLGYFQNPCAVIKKVTGIDIQTGSFYDNEWRYALHRAAEFPTDASRQPVRVPAKRGITGKRNPNPPVPPQSMPENTPANFHFDDVDQVYMRSDWGPDAIRTRLWAGSVFGKAGAPIAKRYNWAHCKVNQGSFFLARGQHVVIAEAGHNRTYRKSAGNNNCILVNDTDQWAGGQVWHPKLEPEQLSRVAFFADGDLLSVARVDLTNAYPPAARAKAISRCLIHLKPDHFLVFDRVETDGDGKAEWRFHAAYVEPAGPVQRFTAYGFKNAKPKRGVERTYENCLEKIPDASCQIDFLTPGVKAAVATSDVYYRYTPFSMPTRHLKVVQQGRPSLTLLTAFAPELKLQAKGKGAYLGRAGDVSWAVLVGPGKAGDLTSDAYLAVAARHETTGAVEVYRFGGKDLQIEKLSLPDAAADVFAVLAKGRLERKQVSP